MELIKVNDLKVSYDNKLILKDLSMSFMKNKITAIIGPSGCGKSTFLMALNLMLEEQGGSYSGEILFKDKDIREYNKDNIRKMIGMVFQKPTPFPLSIYKNMIYAPVYYGIKDKKELQNIVEYNLRRVGLFEEINNELNMSAMKLSGGQQQRLSIARALTVEPEVLLLDEPCSSLDIKNTAIIEEMLLKLSKEYTIIIVTHNLSQARRISDYTAFILNGELIEYGKTEEMFSNPKNKMTKEYLEGIYG
ncbi:phosphate ABC transporter ATP-binding protein, PhoT family [Tissierella praeacuta DSM 18095]|uniref:Phosphate ABC transporter ATP-binding protein, PhoT family n=1 Tax=Tissierella praeacuta DSM 18095 TaxID=1123404 RepID=A0A1M4S5T5_9FIRM|nr:phosphate ABC transporter ATP-binding protein [Tissierella praeacuta]TCU71623.1 phosphate ABC transporter ATP-binding protein (PhoT family) [Tissierella praeacuta]SHE27565.1 phosphate ABC transporter ATP-binding protein, PhoT family [Tissierella praeacuta DSM 18095]SUP00924.1 Phosphate import ATP-binding protein PstB 3 [Tissierella praeacuta]